MDQFRNIGIIGRMGSVKVVESLRQLKQYLTANNYHVIIEEDTATMIPGHGLQVASKKLLGEICDLVIVVGGDGSLLGAAREMAKRSEEHTSELQSRPHLVCRLLLEKKKNRHQIT